MLQAVAVKERPDILKKFMRWPGSPILITYILIFLIFSLTIPGFLSTRNVLNLTVQASILLLLALGQFLVILTEGIDLSCAAVLNFTGVVVALLLQQGFILPLAIIIGLICAIGFGTILGFSVAYGGIPPFIASFGVMGIAGSLAIIISKGNSIVNLSQFLITLADDKLLGIPNPLLISIMFIIVFYFLLYYSKLGTYILAIGGNINVVRLSGINARFYLMLTYIAAAIMYGLASLLMVGRLHVATPNIAMGMEFEVIGAVILGGTSFSKGEGTLLGTVIGVYFIIALKNGLNIAGISPYIQSPLVGMVILLSIIFAQLNKKIGRL